LTGFGLAKLDKDSNLVWRYSANVHHDVEVAEDGTIYAVRQRYVRRPIKGLEFLPYPCVADDAIVLSPDGEEKQVIPLLEAFRDSNYAPLLGQLAQPETSGIGKPLRLEEEEHRRDVLHTNHVEVLPARLADKFPMFKPRQLLMSSRRLNTIFMLDPESSSLVWAAQGPWRGQHDPRFLDNGHLLIFDNLGLGQRGSRVLEYDPATQAIPWCCSGESDIEFFSNERGLSQRLPNGNTLIVPSHANRLLEVTASKELVWSCELPSCVHYARRYAGDELAFVKKEARPR
jgi:Arylsulfotransferase (ASST)